MGGGWDDERGRRRGGACKERDDERGRRRGGACKERGADVGWSVSK